MHEVQFLKTKDEINLERIKADLQEVKPGTTVFEMPIEFMYNSTFYIEFLLNQLEYAKRPLGKRILLKFDNWYNCMKNFCVLNYKSRAVITFKVPQN